IRGVPLSGTDRNPAVRRHDAAMDPVACTYADRIDDWNTCQRRHDKMDRHLVAVSLWLPFLASDVDQAAKRICPTTSLHVHTRHPGDGDSRDWGYLNDDPRTGGGNVRPRVHFWQWEDVELRL